jgi:hypothetical protein
MQLILRLPFLLFESLLRQGADALAMLVALVRGGDPDAAEDRFAPVDDAPVPTPAMAPSAAEAMERRFEREREPTSIRPVRQRPVGADGHLEREDAVVESSGPARDVGATITVQAPWAGYDGMAATAVVARLRGADDATRAVAALYEQTHKARATVLRAAS